MLILPYVENLIKCTTGEPLGIPYGKFASNSEENKKEVDPNELPKEELKALATNTTRATKTSNTASATKSNNTTEWAGDKIPKEHLGKLQKKFKLTDDQMMQVMEKSKREHQTGIVLPPSHQDTFHRDLNMLVYVVIISVLVYVVNRDYKDFLSFWFARYFPVEAGTLGLFVPVPKSNTA
jgi:hypothetical protein